MKTKAKDPINYKLLRRVREQILREPRQFFMDWWTTRDARAVRLKKGEEIPNCGTAACIAGWAVALSRGKTPKQIARLEHIPEIGRKELGISDAQAERLFDASPFGEWPGQFRDFWQTAKTPIQRARIAARRINHFIKTKGAE